MFGRDPSTGVARQPLDNVGVQYGLIAFNSGRISAEQFLDLNERIGGYDIDGKITPRRTSADAEALRLAYQTGRVNTGSGDLRSVPIIDVRPYRDSAGNIHDQVRSFSTRARLTATNGRADNHVILTIPPGPGGEGETERENVLNVQSKEALRLMDLWLCNLEKDPRSPSDHRATGPTEADILSRSLRLHPAGDGSTECPGNLAAVLIGCNSFLLQNRAGS